MDEDDVYIEPNGYYWDDDEEEDSPKADKDDDYWLPEYEGKVNWLGDPWPYVAGDPAY